MDAGIGGGDCTGGDDVDGTGGVDDDGYDYPSIMFLDLHLFLQYILDLYFKYFKLSEDVVNRILQVILDLQHFKSSLFIFAATILQSSSAIHHISNIDNYVHQIIKFQSILITSSHSLWSSQSFGHQKAINGFDMPLPVAVCSGLVNPLAPRKGKFHGGLITMSTLCT
ncbi:hypothetical protein Tco_1216865 [Tanacetum coccineum]